MENAARRREATCSEGVDETAELLNALGGDTVGGASPFSLFTFHYRIWNTSASGPVPHLTNGIYLLRPLSTQRNKRFQMTGVYGGASRNVKKNNVYDRQGKTGQPWIRASGHGPQKRKDLKRVPRYRSQPFR